MAKKDLVVWPFHFMCKPWKWAKAREWTSNTVHAAMVIRSAKFHHRVQFYIPIARLDTGSKRIQDSVTGLWDAGGEGGVLRRGRLWI